MSTESIKPVALVSMPTLSARFPSFQLALLKPTLEREGIPVQTFSMFMYFGSFVGHRINAALSDVYPCMVGEWLWTKAAFGDFANNDEYFEIYRDNLESISLISNEPTGCNQLPRRQSITMMRLVFARWQGLSPGAESGLCFPPG